ncbi:MAG: hypothetical protein EZS28_030707 [Streblomastix strix]|uniref:Uncharacterized protein n=1 Tax=Streblomastix strix TaxID=222440 RepID=A0A5J4USY8_9EUKA|nr:MAG: hypothetical protein EZS28_030707 [Streblomastix strix]
MIYGWSYDKIRQFGPEPGRLLHAINDIHKNVTNTTAFHNSPAYVSGRPEVQVRLRMRVCDIQYLIAAMEKLRMVVNAVCITYEGLEYICSRSDSNDQDNKLPRKQHREVELPEEELFDIAVDSIEPNRPNQPRLTSHCLLDIPIQY